MDMVAYGSLTGVDHPGRSFLAHAIAVRYDGLKSKAANALTPLAPEEIIRQARLIGALFRVAYPMTAAMPGILPRIRFSMDGGTLVLHLPRDYAFLAGDHLRNRLNQFANFADHENARIDVDAA